MPTRRCLLSNAIQRTCLFLALYSDQSSLNYRTVNKALHFEANKQFIPACNVMVEMLTEQGEPCLLSASLLNNTTKREKKIDFD